MKLGEQAGNQERILLTASTHTFAFATNDSPCVSKGSQKKVRDFAFLGLSRKRGKDLFTVFCV